MNTVAVNKKMCGCEYSRLHTSSGLELTTSIHSNCRSALRFCYGKTLCEVPIQIYNFLIARSAPLREENCWAPSRVKFKACCLLEAVALMPFSFWQFHIIGPHQRINVIHFTSKLRQLYTLYMCMYSVHVPTQLPTSCPSYLQQFVSRG